MRTTTMYLLFLGLMVSCSFQQQLVSNNRCDVPQTVPHVTPCTSCAASPAVQCPRGHRKTTTDFGVANCSYVMDIGGHDVELSGCTHECVKTVTVHRCCPGFWGHLCLPCPNWSGNPCNWHGTCMDGGTGNGTCVCQEGFAGSACQECTDKNAYGNDCKKQCNCVHGECNNGPDGNGECYCQPPYSGLNCEQVSASCRNCTSYSYCKAVGDNAVCECLPGFKKVGHSCEGVCSPNKCHLDAECTYLGGTTFQCRCKIGFEGDGQRCLPIDPCSKGNGGCPANSTICVYEGPGKSSCMCMSGMEGSPPSAGCALKSACTEHTCDRTARCVTALDGLPRCICDTGKVGDGSRCYGTLLDRVVELNSDGAHKGKLTGTIMLFEKGCPLTLSQRGPFTAFIPLLTDPLTGVDETLTCKAHLVHGQHLYKDMKGFTFQTSAGLSVMLKANKQLLLLEVPDTLYTVVQEDIPAANGIIHIIDKPMSTTVSQGPRDEQHADKTIGDILRKDERYNRFLSLVDNCGAPLPLRGPGPLTVFVPTNQAIDKFRDGRIMYMLTDAKHKLQELLKHHMFSKASLTVEQLAFMPQIQTMANQVLQITTSSDGKILLGDKGAPLETTNIIASNGIIHMVDDLLLPASIVPILPHRCDVNETRITLGQCVRCSYLYETQCPDGSTELPRHMNCDYQTSERNPSMSKGCAKYCSTTEMGAECCNGFYGPDCKPCIGGFQTPCYGKGKCSDGIHGNGSCSCDQGFMGVACHICSNPSKHGENCDEDCRCLHGVCDNRPGSLGVCRWSTCQEGYSGDYCDKTATPCNSDGLSEHCHVHAYCREEDGLTTCVCMPGYKGDGHDCIAVNPCLLPDRGGCDINAHCFYAGPGNASCVCNEGWTGDGLLCSEVDSCLMSSHGGCDPNADCKSIGPGQNECTCKTGYMGDGIICDLINPCLKTNGGCHTLAKCKSEGEGTHTCTCPDGYGGDGRICYGNILEEVEMNREMYAFYRLFVRNADIDLSGNITALIPTDKAIANLTREVKSFWSDRYKLPYLVRAHILKGIFSIEDFDQQVNMKLPTLNSGTEWEIKNISGQILIQNAKIVTRNLPAVNGYIHRIDTVLIPSLADIPPPPLDLMEFLNNSPTLSLFRQAAVLYNLTQIIKSTDYTILIPHDDAVKQYISKSNQTQLDEEVFKYHIINDRVFPDHVHDGMLKTTALGKSYQIMFHFDSKNQTLANDVPLDGTFNETRNGVVMVIPQVLQVHKNRCGKEIIFKGRGRCTSCDAKPRCYASYKPITSSFPKNMRSNCKYRKKVGSRYVSVQGCVMECSKVSEDHSCCPGYFGHDCFKCPGELEKWCSNNGKCQDGNFGSGECLCNEGFHGTSCETCEPGRYGKDCKSECSCAHGKCLDGLEGNGRCLCYKGWKGVSCSVEIVADACGGACDENANCISEGVGATPSCTCVAGFEGNGTFCQKTNLCATANGGCSMFADCTETVPGERTCTCKEGYTGDGVICLEIDRCRVGNGGCSERAECIKTGPNLVACNCFQGYSGNGKYCLPINPCKTDNGGCGKYARCLYIGQGERNCSCMGGHVGDGFDCRGSTRIEIFRRPEAAWFRSALPVSDSRILYGDGPFTTFVPLNNSNIEMSLWESRGRSSDLLRYHIVSCETLMLDNLKTTSKAVTISGHQLTFSVKEGTVYINGDTQIVTSDFTTADGVIHYIDKVLTPYELKDKPSLSAKINFTESAKVYGYTKFSKLIQDANLLSLLQTTIHQPFTMLWPSDAALNSLSEDRQRWLYSEDHRDQLVASIKAHIIRNARLMGVSQPGSYASYRTMHGSKIAFSCDKKLVGNVIINDNSAIVIDRFMQFDVGIAYGIDQLLEPPGLGAHCDGLENRTVFGRCGSCILPRRCPYGTVDLGKTDICSHNMYPMSFPRHSHIFQDLYIRNHFSHRNIGCKRVCQTTSWTPRCCKNHYGRNCQVCPGGLEAPCGNNGNCNDGVLGKGTCQCHDGFGGTACELCDNQHYGPNCTACKCAEHGRCDDGMAGDGSCACEEGWMGDTCQLKMEKKPVCSPECHPNAVCLPDNACQCESQYIGDGRNCTAPDLCGEYNGGCHQHANCTQTGVTVNCSCQAGYSGDGFSCSPINRCVEETNGGCSDFAECQFTGPNERKCECLPGYVGNGIQCLEKLVPPVDRCLYDNGGCDPKATCKDLHFHGNTAGVFHLRSPAGKYQMNYTEAGAACKAEEATLATFSQMSDAQQLGMHLCVAGWIDGKKVGYPTRFPSVKCGDNHVGIVLYKEPVVTSSKYDAYCYRMTDVSCVCRSDYVGNGDFCNGDLSSVIATNSNYSLFYKMLLMYAQSTEGQNLLNFMTTSSSYATLFVPHNSGFTENETLSGRDMEYHISTNNSIHLYDDLKHQGVIPSRLGYNISVVVNTTITKDSQAEKLVNKRLLLAWDIPASNGIIHIIEGPLRAPPLPVFHSLSQPHSAGATASSILVTLLIICIITGLGYYVFKHKNDAFRFHYFRNEDEDASSRGGKPALVSIPNPLYSGSQAFVEPFGDSGQEDEASGPPLILE
ncbi:stabilin-1 isoform X2 [Hypomesus transpacificus]|uniref:stabilin-1 isoform X2 n=1 Tax=Hypomesus transpacificus TaxID=137520 RepID=UPI001F086613|nr:stabilin-1 isoform X2 [Hypomesus transpacificus]